MTTRTGGRRRRRRGVPVMACEAGLASHYLLLEVERDAGVNTYDELLIGALGGMRDASGPECCLRGRCIVEARVLPWRVRRRHTAVRMGDR